jgi:large subunit ribosomal protein L46
VQTAGVNMNTWIIGHAPVGHHVLEPHYIDSKLARPGEKTFFLKGRIMAGQADLKGNLFGLEDFKWLTRNEVEEHVGLRYWSSVRGMLGER